MTAPSPPDNSGWLNEIGGKWLPVTRFVVAQVMDELEVSKDTLRATKSATTLDVTDLLAHEQRGHAEFRTDVDNRLHELIGAQYHVDVSPLYSRHHQLMLHVSLESKETS